MTRVISIATRDYLRQARRLAVSLAKSHPDWTFKLYCDDVRAARAVLGDGAWECARLESIERLGVKRAKFDAYADALREGGFVWLDADVIVLGRLDELAVDPGDRITACLDDLSECSFIADRAHPWPGDAALVNRVYFNSGVFAVSPILAPFFERCVREARDDRRWAAWTCEGLLLDNHFLCAMVNREGIGVRTLDARAFNWQGLRHGTTPMITVADGSMLNCETGLPLRVAHFAGIRDIDAWIRSLPPPVLAHFARSVARGDEDFLAAVGATDDGRVSLQDVALAAAFSFGRYDWLPPGNPSPPPADAFASAATVISYVRSTRPSEGTWNGLACGGAYLEPAEYQFLRLLARRFAFRSILEIGAGETSRLFRSIGADVLCIETSEGPWAQRARDAGATVAIVPFSLDEGFETAKLAQALDSVGTRHFDVVYVDSPIGTSRRSRAIRDLAATVTSTFIAFHDAHRDAELIFDAAATRSWRVHAHCASWRGLVLIGPHDVLEAEAIDEYVGQAPSASVRVLRYDRKQRIATVRLANDGDTWLPAVGEGRWLLSYHCEGDAGASRWDNPRVPLPCTLEPGDFIEMPVSLDFLVGSRCWFDLVQEGRQWMSSRIPALRRATVDF